MMLLSLRVLVILLVPYSAWAQSKNSCHAFQAHKNRPARSCDGRVQIPSGLCSVCGVGVPMNENDGTYSNCQYTSGLETIGGTRNAQCVGMLQEYVNLNPCDGERANDVQDYTSNNPSSSARPRLDFFLYTVCEFACDCVPQINASPVDKVMDTARGNCQAHAYFDVCLLFPQVKLISHETSPAQDVSSLPPVCPLLLDWFQNSGDGNIFEQVPKTSVHPDVDFFLEQMVEATELLLPNNKLWDECIYLESTQQRIGVTGPATPPTPLQPTPTAPSPPRPPTPSGPCTNVAWSADVVDEQCTTEQPICAHISGYQAGLGNTGSFCAKCVHLTRTNVDGGCTSQQPTCVAEDGSLVPNEKVGQRCVGPDTAPPPPPSSSSWRTVNASPTIPTHEEACFVMVNRNAYLIGGRTRRSISVLNVDTLEWSSSADLPQSPKKMHHMQCVAVGTSIYILSAFTGNFPVETALPDTWIFDTITETWSTAPGIPSPRTRGAGAAVYDGGSFIYVAGGNLGGHGPNSEAVALFDVYDISAQTWTSLPDMPNRRDHTGGGFVKNGEELCIAGGRLGDEQAFFNAVVLPTNCYNFGTRRWSTKANIPQGRAGSAYGTTCDGKLMVAGGESFNRAWDRVDVFDGTTWTTVDTLVNGRHGIQLAVSCTSPQVIAIAVGNGGQGGGNPLRSVEFYNGPESQPISIPVPTPQPITRAPTPQPIAQPTRDPTPQPITQPTRDPTPQPITQPDPTPQPITQPTRDPTTRPTSLSPVPPPPTPSGPCVNVDWSADVVDEQCTTEQPICAHSSGYQAGLGKTGGFCAKCVHLTRNSVDGGCTSEQPTCVAEDGSPVSNEKVGQRCQGSPPSPPSGPCVNVAWPADVVDDNCSTDLPVCAQSSQYQPPLGQTGNFCAKCVHLTRTNVDGGCTSQQPTCVAEDGSPVSNEKVGLRCV